MTISGLEMAQKRKCEIPPEDDDGIQILYEKYDDMEVWYSSTKKKKKNCQIAPTPISVYLIVNFVTPF